MQLGSCTFWTQVAATTEADQDDNRAGYLFILISCNAHIYITKHVLLKHGCVVRKILVNLQMPDLQFCVKAPFFSGASYDEVLFAIDTYL